jgi:hypothetical protein
MIVFGVVVLVLNLFANLIAGRSRDAMIGIFVYRCIAVVLGLIALGFAVHRTWFPSLEQRLADRGQHAQAVIVTVVKGDSLPSTPGYPSLEEQMVESARVRYSTPAGSATSLVNFSGEMVPPMVFPGESATVAIVYDPGHPEDALPSDTVGPLTHGGVATSWKWAITYLALAAATLGMNVFFISRASE